MIQFRIPLPDGQHVIVDLHVVRKYVPILIEMEVLCAQDLILDFVRAIITHRGRRWSFNMKRRTVTYLLSGEEENFAILMDN